MLNQWEVFNISRLLSYNKSIYQPVQNKPTTLALNCHLRQSYSYVFDFPRAPEIQIQLWILCLLKLDAYRKYGARPSVI